MNIVPGNKNNWKLWEKLNDAKMREQWQGYINICKLSWNNSIMGFTDGNAVILEW